MAEVSYYYRRLMKKITDAWNTLIQAGIAEPNIFQVCVEAEMSVGRVVKVLSMMEEQ